MFGWRIHRYVDQSELIRGFYYGNEIVPIGDADKYLFENKVEKTLHVLCSLPKELMRPEWYLGQSDYIIPDKDSDSTLFSCLASAMIDESYVLLCRWVGRENTKARLVVLEAERNPNLLQPTLENAAGRAPPSSAPSLKRPSSSSSGALAIPAEQARNQHQVAETTIPNARGLNRFVFYLSVLPFCEDVRDWPFPVIGATPTAKQQRLADDLVDQMMLGGASNSNSSNDKPAATNAQPPLTDLDQVRSSTLQAFHNCLLARVCKPEAPAEDFVTKLWKADSSLIPEKEFKQHFDLTKRETVGGKKKMFWLNDDEI